jgi:tetratricopeptide (TPR) repeat protein
LKINSREGEGPELNKRYHITGHPTVILLRPDGSEVDRIIGFAPPEEYLPELNRILAGDNTFESLSKQVDEHPDDLEATLLLANKYDERGMYTEARTIWQSVVRLADDQSEDDLLGRFKIAEAEARIDTVAGPLLAYLNDNPGSAHLTGVYRSLRRIYYYNQDTLAEAASYKKLVEHEIYEGGETPYLLNGYAWRMTQLEQNLEDALVKIRKAVLLVAEEEAADRTQIMDTEAEVLWKLGRTEEAVSVIDACIELQPEDEYLKEQKAKFLGEVAAQE